MRNYLTDEHFHVDNLQQIRCISCRWCCEHEVHKIYSLNALEVYRKKGITLMYDPKCKYWFAVYKQECKHNTSLGCDIYDSPSKPDICNKYMCPYPGETMEYKFDELIKESEKKLNKMFGEDI